MRKQRLKEPNPKQLPRVRPKELKAQRAVKKEERNGQTSAKKV